MGEKLSLADGKRLVGLARKSIAYTLATGSIFREKAPNSKLAERRGAFVTLEHFPGGELRGCIGLPYPDKPLWAAVVGASFSAAFEDPRFPALRTAELGEVTLEVSVLSVPEELREKNREKLPGQVRVGEHGLIIEKGMQSGLLLPQVATEYGWDSKTFLDQACRKAGLFEKCWTLDECTVKTFSAQVFREEKPEGKIVEEKLG